MLVVWSMKGSPHYRKMVSSQNFAYISDIGASDWGKPIFITGSAFTVSTFGIAVGIERWLRHKGRLIHARCTWAGTFSALAPLFTAAGSIGLMALTGFDAKNYIGVHKACLGVFIIGTLVGASFMCVEKWRTSREYPENRLLRRSYRIKLGFVLAEICLVTILGTTAYLTFPNVSVVVEWIIALSFSAYMASFAIDFLAVPNRSNDEKEVQEC